MGKVIEIGKIRFNANHLRSVSEKKAVADYSHLERSKVVNAWKQANGKTVRNYSKSKKASKKSESAESKENSTNS